MSQPRGRETHMFEKFTDKARRVMNLAQDEARNLGRMFVGTEHLLLALIKEGEGVAAQALAKLDVTYDETIATVDAWGNVTALAPGKCGIICEDHAGHTDACALTVK